MSMMASLMDIKDQEAGGVYGGADRRKNVK